MKIKWAFALFAVFILVMILSLLFNQLNTKMLPSLEEEKAETGKPVLSSQQENFVPVLPATGAAKAARAVTIIKKPLPEPVPVSAPVAAAPAQQLQPASSPSNPSVSTSGVEQTQKAGVTVEGKLATPDEIAKIRSKGIIIQ